MDGLSELFEGGDRSKSSPPYSHAPKPPASRFREQFRGAALLPQARGHDAQTAAFESRPETDGIAFTTRKRFRGHSWSADGL